MTISDLIVEYFEQFGIEYVFAVPGSPLGPLFDALARSERRGGPKAVLSRHEAGAAFIADGYARESGRIGVCCSTTGPGATNLITGVASAYAEQVPMLVITSQTRVPELSFGCFQDSSRDGIDIMSMFHHCTRYNSMITHPNQLERKLAAALATAQGSPKGPAHLSIPIDIFAAEATGSTSFKNLHTLLIRNDTLLDGTAFDRLWEEVTSVLDRNGKMVLLAGQACIGSGETISRFAELTGANIVTTPRGKSAVNPYHPLSRGVFGCAGHASARKALADKGVELILTVGTNLGEWSTSKWDPILMNGKMIHIHRDRSAFARSPMARLHVEGSIAAVFNRLNKRLEERERSQPQQKAIRQNTGADTTYVPAGIEVRNPDCCRPAGGEALLTAPQVYRELIRRLPRQSRFFIDNSNSVPWSIHYFFHSRPESYHLSIEFATMAWAVGAAIGGAFANPDAPSVCITGDGCYLMSAQEITVAVERRLPVLFAVLNDGAYGLIKHGHRIAGSEKVEFPIPPVDFATMARAAGAKAHTIRKAEEFDTAGKMIAKIHEGPILLDILIDPEASPPLAMA